MLNRLIHLLRSNNTVIICTGRGLGSVEEIVIEPILQKLLPQETQILSNLFAATHNGSTIYSIKNCQNCFDFQTEKLVEFELSQSLAIFVAIKEQFGNLLTLEGDGHKSKSKPTSVVLTFKNVNVVPTTQQVSKFLYESGFRDFKVLTPGIGKMDIVSASSGKQKAIEFISHYQNLDPLKIARFGDQGQIGGNDHEMLQHPLGFKVKTPEDTQNILSKIAIDGHFKNSPEFFKNQSKNSEKIFPYHIAASQVRQNFINTTENYIEKLQDNNFYPLEFLKNLKFSFTGAIRFENKEIEELFDSALRDFLLTKSVNFEGKFKYILDYGGEFYARGEGFYCTEKKAFGIESSLERFNELEKNLSELVALLPKIRQFVEQKDSNLEFLEWKSLLSYFDNLKNLILHTFHAFSYLLTQNKIISNPENRQLNENLRNISQNSVSNYFETLNLQKPNLNQNLNSMVSLKIKKVFEKIRQSLVANFEDKAVNKSIRGIMEADTPNQVNLFAKNISQEIINNYLDKKIILVGLHFGGSELPFAIKSELGRQNIDIDTEIVSAHYSNYSNKDGNFKNGYFDKLLDFNDKIVYVLDDGIFTGSSLYKICEEISKSGGDVRPRTMQIGNSRRLGHMQKAGGANSNYLESQINHNAVGITPSARAMTFDKFEILESQDSFNLIQLKVQKMLTSYYQN